MFTCTTTSLDSLDEPRLALICQAARIAAHPTTGDATDLLETKQVDTFATFVSRFVKPRNSVWRQISAPERSRLLEARYPESTSTNGKADAHNFTRIFREWYGDLIRLMPQVLYMAPRRPVVVVARKAPHSDSAPALPLESSTQQTAMSDLAEMEKPLHFSIKRLRDEEKITEGFVSERRKMTSPGKAGRSALSSASNAAEDTSSEKPLHLAIKRLRDEEEVTETLVVKKRKLAAPGAARRSILSTVSTGAEDTGTEESQHQSRPLGEEIARLGRRNQGSFWISTSPPIHC
ncbi:hypothetical protein CTA2_10508 [Colletotrichum tanaceti]|uniref:Uncharacterized protein n=1 Tax=Colletotrichum tanaceti TaxID=1306861 RepID=A0A4U6XWA4_9PEZI|nr:hypothetical protein CTA2_10508 [Colletotrichum tanaceti]TKW60272.1 hypothetical protein CTA1_4751 [Colletotrichum tanaceti]